MEESNRKQAELESKLNNANKRVCVWIVFRCYNVQQEINSKKTTLSLFFF